MPRLDTSGLDFVPTLPTAAARPRAMLYCFSWSLFFTIALLSLLPSLSTRDRYLHQGALARESLHFFIRFLQGIFYARLHPCFCFSQFQSARVPERSLLCALVRLLSALRQLCLPVLLSRALFQLPLFLFVFILSRAYDIWSVLTVNEMNHCTHVLHMTPILHLDILSRDSQLFSISPARHSHFNRALLVSAASML
jgi:hypothetical protein